MASQFPRKKSADRKRNEKKSIPGIKKRKEKSKKKEDEDEDSHPPKPLPSNIIDGRVFEADRPLALSQEEEKEMEEFHSNLKKYHKTAKDIRKEALQNEKKGLKESDKSPKDKTYEGKKSDRIKNIDEETEILNNMIKLDEERSKNTGV